jgi:hypothetical protein
MNHADGAVVDGTVTQLVRPVPERNPTVINVFIGREQGQIKVHRPTHYEMLTVTTAKRRSIRSEFGRGRIAKQAFAKHTPAVCLGYYLDTRHREPNNIAHLLQTFVPEYLLAKEALEEVAFVSRPLLPRMQELLAWFGIDPICTNRPVYGHAASLWLSRGLAQYPIETELICPSLTLMTDVYADRAQRTSGPRRIFLSRKGERSLTNGAEVNALLETHGYQTIYLEEFSIAEQVSMTQAAEHVVAIHGAAMAYLVLSSGVRSVIELMPPNVYTDHFPQLIGNKVQRYCQLIPAFDEVVQFSGWPEITKYKQRPFAVDLDQLERALTQDS